MTIGAHLTNAPRGIGRGYYKKRWLFTGCPLDQTDRSQLMLDEEAGTLIRGRKKYQEIVLVDEIVDVFVEGQHGRSFAPGKLLALGVLGATKQTSTAYLVVDVATAQWRIPLRGGCDSAAHELIEKINTMQRVAR